MELKKVWMSPETGRKSRYGWRTLVGVIGIAALALALLVGGTILSFSLELSRAEFLLALCLGVTAAVVALAVKLGQRGTGDAAVFFLTADDRLYAVDARRLSRHGGGALGYAAGTMETQAFLRRMAERPFLPAGADEIVRVERVRDNGARCAVVCRARYRDRRPVRRTYFFQRSWEDGELLLHQLERRRSWEGELEPREDRGPARILFSALALAGAAALCALSHPTVGRLPQEIYFPCLGAAFAALFCLVWSVVRHRRGEWPGK